MQVGGVNKWTQMRCRREGRKREKGKRIRHLREDEKHELRKETRKEKERRRETEEGDKRGEKRSVGGRRKK